jgi:hypothetical protein
LQTRRVVAAFHRGPGVPELVKSQQRHQHQILDEAVSERLIHLHILGRFPVRVEAANLLWRAGGFF